MSGGNRITLSLSWYFSALVKKALVIPLRTLKGRAFYNDSFDVDVFGKKSGEGGDIYPDGGRKKENIVFVIGVRYTDIFDDEGETVKKRYPKGLDLNSVSQLAGEGMYHKQAKGIERKERWKYEKGCKDEDDYDT
jgi:hypothetical protein